MAMTQGSTRPRRSMASSPAALLTHCALAFLISHLVVPAAAAASVPAPALAPAPAVSEDDLLAVAASLPKFVDELPRMPTLKGYRDNASSALPANLTIGMFQTSWKFHRDLKASTVFAYGTSRDTATVPGPTIEALQGVDTYITWENELPDKHIFPWDPTLLIPRPRHGGVPAVVHRHGGIQHPLSDGHPTAWYTAGYRETGAAWKSPVYHYNNRQPPGNLWYHDHAMGLTRVNLLAGLLGAYVVRNPKLENPFRLPSGPEFDRHLVIFDRSFRRDGSIYINATGNNPSIHPQWQPEYFGDAVIVNGKAWPYMRVKRRSYRFRMINASNARFYRFALSNGLPFVFVGSDSVYIPEPVTVDSFLLSPSEIADVVVDFGRSASDSAILTNSAPYPYPGGDEPGNTTSSVMKFLIEEGPAAAKASTRLPARLIHYDPPRRSRDVLTRYITMYEYTTSADEPTHLYLNGLPFSAPATEKPKEGKDELWHVINLTDDNHPLHIHLGMAAALGRRKLLQQDAFAACMRRRNDAVKCEVNKHLAKRSRAAAARQEQWWKNVLKIEPGHMSSIVVRFAPVESPRGPYPFDATTHPGYVYHCHILDHEDNEMMRPLLILPINASGSGNGRHR